MKDDEKILDHVISELLRDFDALRSPATSAEAGATKNLATLANARNRIAKTIIVGTLGKGDPRYLKLVQGGDLDIAKWVKDISDLDSQKKQLMTYKSVRYRKRSLSVRKSC